MELMETPAVPQVSIGFKRTEAGVIPENWQALRLSDCITVHRGGSPRPIESFITNDLNGVNWIKIGDAERYGKYIRSTSERIIPAGVKFSREVRVGDFLLSNSMSFGRPYILAVDGCIHDGWLVLQNYQATFDKDFLYYTLSDRYLLDQYQAKAAGSGVLNLNKELIGTVHLRVPPFPEQRAIATALSDVDGLLAGLDALIAKKKALKQGAMQQLLTGKQRLPGFRGEWVVRRLGEVAHIKTGARNNEDKVEGGTYPFFVRSENIERINSYSHDCEAILVPGEGRIGEIFHYINGKFDVHQRVYAITQFVPGVSARFIHAYLRQYFGAWAMQNTVKATVDSLRLPTFQRFEMTLPQTVEEQTAIAEALSDMDAELAALEARRAKTALLKQGMMQELLTGRTRLV